MNNHVFELRSKDKNTKKFIAVRKAVAKIKPEKKRGLYGVRTHDLCDTGAVNLGLLHFH